MTKDEVKEKLKKIEIPTDRLNGIDNRLSIYFNNLWSNPDGHNKYELLAAIRFLDFLDKYTFKRKLFRKFINFYEFLKFPSNGKMESFKLTPIQVFQFASILGFYKEDGTRLTRNALLFIPRKFSKTTSLTALAVYDLLFGDFNAQAYVCSNSFNQSMYAFDIIKKTLKELDPNLTKFRLNKDFIYCKINGRGSLIRCLASKADKLDGLNASVILCDELSNADNFDVLNVLSSSMLTRKNPLTIAITTASNKLDAPFVEMLSNYKKVLEGELDNDAIFASIFEPDEGDDIGDERTWWKVQPHMGVTTTIENYREQYKKALMSANELNDFKTKQLNIFCIPPDAEWVSDDAIESHSKPLDFSKLKSKPQAMVTVDLSVKDDFSCVCYGLYDSLNKRFYFKNYYYIPETTAKTHSNAELYQRLIEQGHLIICGKDTIDYSQIAQDILKNTKYLNILEIGYDAYKSKDFINILRAAGFKNTKPYKQTYSNFTSPIASFEWGLYENRYQFDDNPLNRYCFRNAYKDEDSMGNTKIMKKHESSKIDGAICILMNIGMFQNYQR